MLIILPPSETKREPPDSGPVLALSELSFPTLNPARRMVLEALRTTSAGPDAFERLRVGPALVADVARDTHLRDVPTLPVLDVYSGPLHEALDAASLSSAAKARADSNLVVASALWGALRPADRIPPYRLHVCSRLVGVDRLEPLWRSILPAVLTEAAGERGVILDLRSPMYQAIGKPIGFAERTVTVRVGPAASQGGDVGNVVAKRTRGLAARYLLESGADPDDPELVAVILGEHWPVHLDEPLRPGTPWTLSITPL